LVSQFLDWKREQAKKMKHGAKRDIDLATKTHPIEHAFFAGSTPMISGTHNALCRQN